MRMSLGTKRLISGVALAIAASLFPSSLSADERLEKLPENHRKWLEEDVVYIISDVERETFLTLEGETERNAFVQAFWRQRDSNPNTLENEYRTEHYARIDYANEFLGRDTYLPGWKTDRGKFHILLGEPMSREDFSHSDAVYPAELWFYQNPELLKLRLPSFFYLLFFKRGQTGTFTLYDHSMDGPGALLTGYQASTRGDFRNAITEAYDQLYEVSPELAHASLSFRTDEGNVAADVTPFGTMSLLDDVYVSPLIGVNTDYAERFSADRGIVESDYLFSYAASDGVVHVLPGPGAYYVHWAIEMSPEHVAVVRDTDRGRYGSIFDASIEVTSAADPDMLILQRRFESFLDIDEEQSRSGLRLPFLLSGMTPLIPGTFDVRVILRNKACPGRFDDDECRKSYTLLQQRVEIPRVQFDQPALTTLVLAHRLERTTEPKYRSYQFGSLVLHPTPSATFTSEETLLALCEPLNAPTGSTLRYRIVERDSGSPLTEQSVPVGPRIEPTTQSMSLDGLEGGRYTLSITLESSAGQTLAERSAEFQLTPRSQIPRPAVRGTLSQTAPEIPGSVSMLLGDQLKNLGNEEAAQAHFEDSVTQNPRLVPALERYAPYLLEAGDGARVVELLAPVYEKLQDRHPILTSLGNAYYLQGEHTKTIEVLERALSLEPLDVSRLKMLAEAHRRVGNDERAEALAKQIAAQQGEP